MNTPIVRPTSDAVRSGYSEDEITSIYALAVSFLENGALKQAEIIFNGLSEIAPDFIPAWLGLAYVRGQEGNYEEAQVAVQQALRFEEQSAEGILFLITFLLTTGDIQSAGTYLGEIADKIDGGQLQDPTLIRFFRAQLVRYQAR